MAVSEKEFLETLENLCGIEFDKALKEKAKGLLKDVFSKKKLTDRFSYRQLNEVLLLCNEDTISKDFFDFLSKGKNTISFKEFKDVVNKFRKIAMLQFGSFRFAFNYLSKKNEIENEFGVWIKEKKEIIKEFKKRSDPIMNITEIEEKYLPYLGYLYEEDIDKDVLKIIKEQGQNNFETYLTYDYLDVYVATSMREKRDYSEVHNLCREVFKSKALKELKIRYFDPTQNYHENSISKGLIEGLMLKRAKCTLYLVQLEDTMGKDSEMASTLAQGKPVIAYIPQIDITKKIKELKEYTLIDILEKAKSYQLDIEEKDKQRYNDFTEIFSQIQQQSKTIIEQENKLKKEKGKFTDFVKILANTEKKLYNKRANTLKYLHPLRFQIDLATGVANGVLVVRTPKNCINVIKKVLTNDLKFKILKPGEKIDNNENKADNKDYRLVEEITSCAFRVVSKDEKLTNSFWNLYLKEK